MLMLLLHFLQFSDMACLDFYCVLHMCFFIMSNCSLKLFNFNFVSIFSFFQNCELASPKFLNVLIVLCLHCMHLFILILLEQHRQFFLHASELQLMLGGQFSHFISMVVHQSLQLYLLGRHKFLSEFLHRHGKLHFTCIQLLTQYSSPLFLHLRYLLLLLLQCS